MEKRSAVAAVYAESLVFESNFGSVEDLTTDSSDEAAKHAQSIRAAVLASANPRMSEATKSPVRH
jgi:hypothetical protein